MKTLGPVLTTVYTILCLASLAGAQAPTVSLPPGSVLISPTQTGSTYAQVALSVPAGTPNSVWSATYNGWCINPKASLKPYSATLYSSYDAALPADEGTAIQWQKINWILNHKQGNSGTLSTVMLDVQQVIWRLLFSTSVYRVALTPAGTSLLGDANTYGVGFVPGPGELMAVVLYAHGVLNTANQNAAIAQDLIIEYLVGGRIGDFVWKNAAQDGLQNPGEMGINGVTVELHNGSTLVASTVTADAPAGYPYPGPTPAGYYQFSGLPAGTYTVVVPDQPALSGLYRTLYAQGSNPEVDSNGTAGASNSTVATVTLATDSTVDETIDFGFYAAPQITLACPPMTAVEEGGFYNSALETTGAIAPSVFSITSGSLPAGVTLNTSSGALTGVATAPGTHSFSAQVVDSRNSEAGTATASCGITVFSPPTASCVAITAIQGVAIEPVTIVGSGGEGAPYTFTATGLPAGLSISAGGTISGTPTVSGSFSYTLTVSDKNGNKGTVNCSVTVVPPVAASCVSITAVQGVAITPVTMAASGGAGAPYTFTATGLPAGLSISAGGTISGTPTVSGTFSYTIIVSDRNGNTGTVNCSVMVVPPLTAGCVSITAVQGVAITPVTLVASGGAGAPYTFTATGLPAGLSMSAGGTISGTPTVTGTFTYTVTVTDTNGNKGTANCSVTVTSSCAGHLRSGDTATIGYWRNKNGQALIKALNGGPASTNLANWLASQFPYLYGASSAYDMTNKSNADVAALFVAFFNVRGQRTNAQVLAGALAVYVTNKTLAGTTAQRYGFNISISGTGAKTYNVGSNGAAIGLSNNTSYTVLQLLYQADLMTQAGTFNANAFNAIFDGINQQGDIS